MMTAWHGVALQGAAANSFLCTRSKEAKLGKTEINMVRNVKLK